VWQLSTRADFRVGGCFGFPQNLLAQREREIVRLGFMVGDDPFGVAGAVMPQIKMPAKIDRCLR
jgi:hypothetical protein